MRNNNIIVKVPQNITLTLYGFTCIITCCYIELGELKYYYNL